MLAQYEFNKIFGIPNHPPCANCGKINGGFMSSTAWEHGYECCSDRCGFRLKKRIENGMYPNLISVSYSKEREECLRYRIKHLEKQLKLLGHKPIGTPESYKED